ncbi:uncharacterized protein LOC119663677, partial [Teleopsis dalmanni]
MALRVEAPDERVDDLLHRLFESKEIDMAKGDTLAAVDLCECIFMSTHKRFDDGSYCVQIPFTPDAPPLGNSHQMALRQFHQLERKLASNSELRQRYVAFMRKYEQLGHMHPIQHHSGDSSQAYYIPHHAVMAKFRVVFNASAKTSNGISSNDTQLAGPSIQDLLLNLLPRFRQHRIAFTADVEKMFRQVKVDERHRQWQQILWRESSDQPIRTYQLATVTYGTTSGTYLAVRAMQQCGRDNSYKLSDEVRAKTALHSILNDFYVDDYLKSTPSIGMAIQLAADVSSVLADGQFHLRKWKSNSAEVLAHLLGDADPCQLYPHLAETTVLGLHWDPLTDELFYQVSSYDAQHLTKRQVLSDAAKLYDPIGMLAPVIITAKLFIQKLWQAKLEWDDPLPLELLQEWLIYRRQLSQLEAVRIPRWIGMQPGYQIQLHGFCDASVKAMAAALYLATNHNGNITSHIIVSKTKVAPLHS